MTDRPAQFGVDWISQILANQLATHGGANGLSCEVTGPIFERSNSRIFLVRHPRLPGPAALKLCLLPYTSTPDGRSAREQFEALMRTHAAMAGSGHFGVPEPYFLDEGHGVLGMEWIPGLEMTTVLFSSRCSGPAAEGLISRAGEWLQRFHCAGRVPQRCLDTESRLVQLTADRAIPLLAGDPVFLHAVRRVTETATAAGAVLLDNSWIHGDFKTDNLMVSGERIIGLDIHGRFENTIVNDIAPFLNHLELKLLHPRAWRLWGSRDRLVNAFLAGYGFSCSGPTMLALCWVRLCSMLTVWESVAKRQRSGLHALGTRLLFRRATSRLIRELEECGVS